MSTSNRYRSVIEYFGGQRSHDLSPLELQRISATVGMIPLDVGSVLDVGCGDGRILDRLPAGINAVGADYAYRSLGRLGGKAVCASSERLPFSNSSFDLVLCCEVLEHLPDQMFRRTLDELRRIARRYILISVPYKENLRLGRTRCPDCGTVFHVWGHVRRFTSRGLDRLFADCLSTSTRYVGKREPYQLGCVLYVNQTYGGRWADWKKTTMCPQCGDTVFRRTPRNLVTIGCGVVNRLTARVIPVSRRNWVLKLYSCHGKVGT